MVICKFYVQGNCRFGENCKFEHQIGGSSHSTSILRQQTLNHGSQQQSTGGPVDNSTIIKMVQMDMTNTEKGGQWLLSCYTPFKDKPPFPGFEDKSFEEVRLAFYEAKNNGTLESFKQEIQNNTQKNIVQIKALQNPNQEAQNLILEIYHSPPGTAKTFTASPSLFSCNNLSNTFTNTSNSPFGQSQNSIFGGNSTSNAFGNNQSSIFGGNTTTNTFGNNTNQYQNAFGKSGSIFGGASQQSMFGAPSSFGSQPSTMNYNQNSNTSSFQTQASIFGNNSQNTTVFGQSSSVFANPAVQQQASLFSQQGTAQTFGNNQPTPTSQAFTGSSFTSFRNPSESMNTGSMFSSQPPTSSVASSIFANAVANFTASQKSNTPFGGNPNVPTSFVSSSSFASQSPASTSETTPAFSMSPFNSTPAFNSGNSAMVFTTSQSTPTDLSNKPQPSQNTSIFNTQNFQTSTAPVAPSQGASIFSSQPASATIFARPPTGGSIFSTQPTAQNTSIFGSASTITPVATQTGSIFGQQPSGAAASNHTTSIFGGARASSSGYSSGAIGSLTESFRKAFYSQLEDLTEEEVREFKADAFEFGKIPDRPPPLELCK